MNTYSITYWPPGLTAAQTPLTVQADEFTIDRDYALFFQKSATSAATILAVPLALNPIITQTSTS